MKKSFLHNIKDIFNSEKEINQTVQEIYARANSTDNFLNRTNVYYGDVKSAQNILLKLASSVFNNTDRESILFCNDIYIQVWIRSRGGLDLTFSSPSYIKQALCAKWSNPQKIEKCVDLSLGIIFSHEPSVKQRVEKAEEIFNVQEALSQYTIQNAKKNEHIQNLYLNDPEYGLVPNKPIFVDGFGAHTMYLSHLCTNDGANLEYSRLGSMEIEGICGPVDKYSLIIPGRGEYLQIFVCNYGLRTLRTTPKGLKYVD